MISMPPANGSRARDLEVSVTDGRSFASSSLPRHLVRGVVGFGALVGSVVLVPVIWPVSLALAAVGVLAFRGCPTCWAIGLAQTISRGRLQRSCSDGGCELKVAERPRRSA
jgi:hypothetical protein